MARRDMVEQHYRPAEMSVPSSDVEFCCHNTEFRCLCWPLKDLKKLAGSKQNIKECRCLSLPRSWAALVMCLQERAVSAQSEQPLFCSRTEEPGEQRFCENRRLKNSQWDCLFPNGPTLRQCSSGATVVWCKTSTTRLLTKSLVSY